MPFKVIQDHQKPICDFLLVISTISKLSQTTVQICTKKLSFCVFESRGLRATDTVRLRLIGKHAVDFLGVLIATVFAKSYG